MNSNNIRSLKNGLGTAFIDHTTSSNLAYKPQFISNSCKEGRKVISSVEDELLSCDEFCISVAFITMSGITPLLQALNTLRTHVFSYRELDRGQLVVAAEAADNQEA